MGDEFECPVVVSCLEECDEPNICPQTCYAVAVDGAQAEADAVFACGIENNCMDDMCIQVNCGPEVSVCYAGDGDCPTLAACVEACGGAEPCGTNCFANATFNAQGSLSALFQCAEANSCEDQVCLDANCAAQQTACFG